MKKAVIVTIIVGMFAWAVYDLVGKTDESTISEESDDQVDDEQNVLANHPREESSSEEESNTPDEEDTIGLEAGNFAPDFELATLDGGSVRLSDFRGERVMLNFWATWCPPCRAEMPDMQKFHEDTDAVILAVNLTETENSMEGIVEFTENFGLTFPILLDENIAVADLYQIKPIPTSFMIDSEGRIQNKAFGALNYDLMVQEFEMMK